MDYYLDAKGNQVQAMLLTPELAEIIATWCGGMAVEEIDPFDEDKRYPALNVQCKDGVKRASLGDWIVKYADKSFDVLKPIAFAHTHRHWEA